MKVKGCERPYLQYPDESPPMLWAYGFRSFFAFLLPYILLSSVAWLLFLSGKVSLFRLPVMWHVYEFIFGIGQAGIAGFILTAVPELIPGQMPVVGKRLKRLVFLWLLARLSFWTMDFIGVYPAAFLNLLFSAWVIKIIFRPVILDPLQAHAELGYTILAIFAIQTLFFLGLLDWAPVSPMAAANLSLGAFIILILQVIKRVTIEVGNQALEAQAIDDVYLSRPYRYNFAVFCAALYGLVEFFAPNSNLLGWLGIAAFFACLNILNDAKLKDANVLFKSLMPFIYSIPLLAACGYLGLGLSHLFELGGASHLRHLLATGAFGLSFYLVFFIVTMFHTGRALETGLVFYTGYALVLMAALIRGLIYFYPNQIAWAYIVSSLCWIAGFGLFYLRYRKLYMLARVDGMKG